MRRDLRGLYTTTAVASEAATILADMGVYGSNSAISAVATLNNPVRKALYDAVHDADHPLTRDEAATALRISHNLAAFHLDKLVAAGLLQTGAKPSGRPRQTGRIPKTYELARDPVEISFPARAHQDLAQILLDAIGAAGGPAVTDAARAAARTHGMDIGQSAERPAGRLGPERALAAVEKALDARGYQPYRPDPTCIRLRNCPFHPASQRTPQIVCALNLELCTGILDGMAADSVDAVPVSYPGHCCVEIHAQ